MLLLILSLTLINSYLKKYKFILNSADITVFFHQIAKIEIHIKCNFIKTLLLGVVYYNMYKTCCIHSRIMLNK